MSLIYRLVWRPLSYMGKMCRHTFSYLSLYLHVTLWEITVFSRTKYVWISADNQSCRLLVASGSSGSRALMLACSGTTQSPHSLWAATQQVHTSPVIYLDLDSLKDCSHCGEWWGVQMVKIKLIINIKHCWTKDKTTIRVKKKEKWPHHKI